MRGARRSQTSIADLPEPIRDEIWGIERLEQHAASLAATQRVRPGRRGDVRLAPRLRDNGRVLLASYRRIAEAIRQERAITPASEWLVDNFHLVEEQLREIREDLPPGFYRELPKLASDPFRGYPRVYALAHDFLAHTDSLFDAEALSRFILAYQRQQTLTLGELWAVAISLRVVLVENLRRLAERMVSARRSREQAEDLADLLLDAKRQEGSAALLRRYESGALGSLDVPFAVTLLARLRDRDPEVTPALTWLHRRLAEQGTTAEEIVATEYQRQTANDATVRNVITSMRLISAFDWAELVESVSLVEAALSAHPGYREMEFATRDRYRHAVEELARGARLSEVDVAQQAVRRATAEPLLPPDRPADPGYELIGSGRPAFERELRARLPLTRWIRRLFVAWATPGYLSTLAVDTAVLLALPLWLESQRGAGPLTLVTLGLLALIPASDLAMQLLNSWVMDRLGPKVLPRMELRGGIPAELRTLVAVPTLLTSAAEIDEQIGRLEVHYLANPEAELRFALLSDWKDAPAASSAEDAELLAAAAAGIERLNAEHGPAPAGDPRFLLLHRRRVWSGSEQCWLGWERKRGKLEELNRLLRGATDTTFLAPRGPQEVAPPGIRYVLTLDADTRLPREAARKLAGTLAHPLNRPRFEASRGRVTAGYGVLQPRIAPTLPTGEEGSLFQRIFSGPAGIDPYAAAVSDVYQDLFAEGSYTGKGIYDVDAFVAALDGKVPAGRMLSHDLFEGLFARAGLVTDMELFEEFPSHFAAAASRQHRWARGDWQLLPWIFGRGPTDCRLRTPIPVIGRFKMLDNLRRTLSAPAAFLTLLAAWTLPGASPGLWTGFVLATMALPALLHVLAGLIPRRRGISKRSHLRAVAEDLVISVAQVVLSVTFLAHQAWLMTDAILRTLWRLTVSRRRLLQWVTAAQAKAGLSLDLAAFYRQMDGGLTFAALAAFAVAVAAAWAHRHGQGPGPGSWTVWCWPAPLLALWALAPAVARWISLPPALAEEEPLDRDEAQSLRLLARRTWGFFETFVGAEDHALPPDNFQDLPKPVVAHRTSPTNLGLYLLTVVAARDFGWLGTLDCVGRLEETLKTMRGLKRLRGHFYNWYDTRTLEPLDPRYVSTVDSGNLAGHLLTLAEACRQMADGPLLGPQALAGIGDAIALIRAAAPASAGRRTQTVTRRQLDEALDALAPALEPLTPVPSPIPSPPPEEGHPLPAESESPPSPGRREGMGEGGRGGEGPQAAWRARLDAIIRGLHAVVDVARALAGEQAESSNAAAWKEALAWAELAQACAQSHARDLEALRPEGLAAGEPLASRLAELSQAASDLCAEMDFGFLLDPIRNLFSIGYRVAEGELDKSYYDLLASEARLASFIAIAKGDVPVAHWFRLGRPLTPAARGAALISWSGSMFEYLMPALVMRSPANSLLGQTCRLVVQRQISYGAERGVPWGVSESAFNARDLELTYQYSNFGVPGLGLKRGLSEDVVVAPYATALAAMFEPREAVRNFARLESAGALGRFGFYEAIDYTSSRLPDAQDLAVVHAFMAHHQGMTLLALANVLDVRRDGAMPARFHAAPLVQATELLLQERTPRDVEVARPRAEEVMAAAQVSGLAAPVTRRYRSPHHAVPTSHLLGNGRYTVMITAAGAGYSRFRDVSGTPDIAVTRFREDSTRDCWGTFLFLRDAQSGEVWSAGFQASGVEPDSYEAVFSEDRAEIVRRDRTITCRLEVVVAAEDDAEVRRVSLTNRGPRAREIELTSYAEIVLAPQAADVAHPAFSNLFVETEHIPRLGALLASRRPRSAGESRIWAAHVVAVPTGLTADDDGGPAPAEVQYETDRMRFLGRGRGVRTPMSVIDGHALSNTAGAVLDPIFSLRRTLRLAPFSTVRVTFSTLVAPSREAALVLADKYRDPAAFERAAAMAWTQAQVQLRHLGILPDEANLFQRLANRILYSDPSLRPPSEMLQRNTLGPSALWGHGLSGDLPIVLVRIDEIEDIGIVRQLLKALEYFRLKHLAVDLVILNERSPSYVQDLQAALEALVRASQSRLHHEGNEAHGNAFVLRADLLAPEVRGALLTAARAVLVARNGTLSEQIVRRDRAEEKRPPRRAAEPQPASPSPPTAEPRPRIELEFWNGLGGFANDGREYVTILGEGQWTPAPWINVIANPGFGFQVSESGAGSTWSVNSRENQLTPWSNDPVSDPPGETFYVRDEESGLLWGPTVLPIREEAWPYVARHGLGYSRFEHTSHGVTLELLQFVPPADPVKISRLTLVNREDRPRRLAVTAYVEWVLGTSRSASAPFIVTALDESGAIVARNPWSTEFGSRVAFAVFDGGRQTAYTGDRTEFLGRNGTLDHPASLERGDALSGRVGAGLDPCAALQTVVELRPGARADVVFLLGQGGGIEEVRTLVQRYSEADLDAVLAEVVRSWEDVTGALQVKTPDRAMDLLLNRWLLYQTVSCRLWSRTAFYQAGGAYGFRDQLQDSLALTVARREITREQILRSASRQFVEGDVQHWWHPPAGRGVRTHMSDDLLWLPFAVLHYLDVTGEETLLDADVPFIEGAPLPADQEDAYFAPEVSAQRGTLFEHCARALDARLTVGRHGLPLMGTGDWNDGMNRIGRLGQGESVWLGWFLCPLLTGFAGIAERRASPPDLKRAKAWRRHAAALRAALEKEGWDGDWYRRAFFDDGTPVGSAASEECRIDSIAQTWAVLSGVAEPSHAARAMASVDEQLVRRDLRDGGLVLLFTPPFDKTPLDPGYIKGYVPGVRENGGQYTHAAVWCILAFAALGDGDKAAELFAILNPINHGKSRAGIRRYKVEPYVMAGDVYAEPTHLGRGGWTWYTGSAGWMVRAGVESILGFRLRGATLSIDPVIPRSWPSYEITFRYHAAEYAITVENPRGATRGVTAAELDGAPLPVTSSGAAEIGLVQEGRHQVRIVLG